MTLLEAIEKRISRRDFLPEPLAQQEVLHLQTCVKQINGESGLSIELVVDASLAAQVFGSSDMIQGAPAYFAMIGDRGDPSLNEKIGYYGERLVLEAVREGIDGCWVSGTYDPAKAARNLPPEKQLVCVVALGHAPQQQTACEAEIYARVHAAKRKDLGEMMEVEGEAPGWFLHGVQAVQKAPSAMHRQPVVFQLVDGKVVARLAGSQDTNSVDYGIAKCHFEIGSSLKI